MTPAELIAWMQVELFPKWDGFTAEQLAAFAMAISGHDPDLVKIAMRQHWRNRGSFTSPILKDLMAIVYELEAGAIKSKAKTEEEEPSRSLPEIIRHNNPAWRKVDNDFELIIRYYRQLWWLRAKKRIDAADENRRDAVRAGYETQIKDGCFNALSAHGMCERRQDKSWSFDFAGWASTIILDRDDDFEIAMCEVRDNSPRTVQSEVGGRMPAVNWPAPPKPAATTPFQAIKALAVAEHAQTDTQLAEANAGPTT
jgi:hypothetical protein